MGCASSSPEDDKQSAPMQQNSNPNSQSPDSQSNEERMAKRRLSVAPQHAALSTVSAPISDPNSDHGNLSALEVQAKGDLKVAMVSRKGLVPYNKNKVNQDRYVVKYALGDDPGICLWGVMDGHGEYGHYVAAFVQENLPICIGAEKNIRNDPEGSITRAVAAMCSRLSDTDINCAFSGTTLVFGVRIDSTLYIANIGDSRAVLATQQADGSVKALALSNDHKPERPDEKARIIAHGGRVEPLPGPPGECGPARVWLAEADVPGLAMSRSIGDEVSQTVGVLSVPEFTKHELKENDIFVIWASDGVWEFVSDEAAVNLVWKHRDNIVEAAAQLAEESTKMWRKEEEVIDDITTCIVQFNLPK